jgi:undecaprenyl-diphosphatase
MFKQIYPILILIVAVLAFVHLTSEVKELETQNLDIVINQFLLQFRNPALTRFMMQVSTFGENLALISVGILALYTLYQKKYASLGILTFCTSLALMFTFVFKKVIQRSRPDIALRLVSESSFSYPSGHATVAFTIYPILGIWLYANTNLRKPWKFIISVFLILFACLIGLSRLYLGVHYFSDILAGSIVGLCTSWMFFKLESQLEPTKHEF